MNLHDIRGAQFALVTLSDGGTTLYTSEPITAIHIDWDYYWEGDPEPDDIREKIREIRVNWPDGLVLKTSWGYETTREATINDLLERFFELWPDLDPENLDATP